MKNESRISKKYMLLYAGIFIYSVSALLGKVASFYPIQSLHFFLFMDAVSLSLCFMRYYGSKCSRYFP